MVQEFVCLPIVQYDNALIRIAILVHDVHVLLMHVCCVFVCVCVCCACACVYVVQVCVGVDGAYIVALF